MSRDRHARLQATMGRPVMGTWVTLLLATSWLLSASAQVEPAAAAEGDVELYLFAEYAPGLRVPARAPQLIAKSISSKRIDCLHRRASTISGAGGEHGAAAAILEAGAPAVANARCLSAYPLKGGLYTLQASYVRGANWATWSCYKNTKPEDGVASTAAAAPAAVPLFSSQAVQLDGGNSYTCIASYTPQTPEQTAAIAAISWPEAMAAATASVDAVATISDADPLAGCSQPSYKQPPRGRPAAPLDLAGSLIINSNTKDPVKIRGINWFGFNVPMGMVDGLWAGGSEATTDFATIAYQLTMLGYNAVRLPFAHTFLAKTDVWDLKRDCTAASRTLLKQRLMDPNDVAANSRKVLPDNVAPMANPSGQCNTYLPMRNNEDRLLYVVQQFVALGMYVVLDYQPQGLEQHPYNLQQFVDSWAGLWRKVTCLPNFNDDIAGRVLIDVMNEPDSMGIRWEASGDRPGAEQLYLATADALWKISPNKMLFMFEGTGQNMIGLNWGNGFVTDQEVISSRGLSNPTSFFNQVVTKPYVKKVVFSPHLYPPSITMSTWLGEELWKQSNVSFGYLQSPGYCVSGSCTNFPVLVGETGSAYHADTDKTWLADFSDFAMARGRAAAFTKQPVNGWMWWCYNENSGDTGGIVMNQWQDLNWDKLRYMMNQLDLVPWYKQPGTQVAKKRRGDRVGNGGSGGGSEAMSGDSYTYDYTDGPVAASGSASAPAAATP